MGIKCYVHRLEITWLGNYSQETRYAIMTQMWRGLVLRRFAWLDRFRRLEVRYEHGTDIYQAFLLLGGTLICPNFINGFC